MRPKGPSFINNARLERHTPQPSISRSSDGAAEPTRQEAEAPEAFASANRDVLDRSHSHVQARLPAETEAWHTEVTQQLVRFDDSVQLQRMAPMPIWYAGLDAHPDKLKWRHLDPDRFASWANEREPALEDKGFYSLRLRAFVKAMDGVTTRLPYRHIAFWRKARPPKRRKGEYSAVDALSLVLFEVKNFALCNKVLQLLKQQQRRPIHTSLPAMLTEMAQRALPPPESIGELCQQIAYDAVGDYLMPDTEDIVAPFANFALLAGTKNFCVHAKLNFRSLLFGAKTPPAAGPLASAAWVQHCWRVRFSADTYFRVTSTQKYLLGDLFRAFEAYVQVVGPHLGHPQAQRDALGHHLDIVAESFKDGLLAPASDPTASGHLAQADGQKTLTFAQFFSTPQALEANQRAAFVRRKAIQDVLLPLEAGHLVPRIEPTQAMLEGSDALRGIAEAQGQALAKSLSIGWRGEEIFGVLW